MPNHFEGDSPQRLGFYNFCVKDVIFTRNDRIACVALRAIPYSMRGLCTFRKRDVTTAIKAVAAAGLSVVRVEIEAGKIVVITGQLGSSANARIGENEWDSV